MSIIITTNEPKSIKELFIDRVEIPMGFDMKLLTKSGTVGIERKKIPGDLIASIEDGRLGKEILAMREECSVIIVLYHGVMTYNKYGQVRQGKRTSNRWTNKGMRNLRRTLEFVEGCYIEYARTNEDLVKTVNELQTYLDQDNHLATKGRLPIRRDWLVPTRQERVRYFYSGLPRVAAIGAKKLELRFPNPMDLYQASVKDIMSVQGFAKKSAMDIYNFLRSG